MRTRRIAATAALAALVASGAPVARPASAQLALTTIEGHVFGKTTGVPLEGAAVTVTVFDEQWNELGSATAYTDSNGFYSTDVNALYVVRIDVACETPRGVVTSFVNPPKLGPEIVRRDAYLDTPSRASFTRCGGDAPG